MSRARPKVVYWNHSPTPYFVERFNAIARSGGLDFEAWFNERREQSRSWEVDETRWRFPARYIPPRNLLGCSVRVPIAELRATRPDVLVQEYDRAHLSAGFLAGRALASRTAFRVLPNYDSWSERTWWRQAGKHVAFRAVDAAKTPGPDGQRLAERYGLPAERVSYVTQSIDPVRLARSGRMSGSDRAGVRRELGLGGCVFIYVGRLWSGKGTDVLLDAYEQLARTRADVSLLILGDGVDEDRYRRRARSLPRIVFAGFIQADEIASWYALADAMVFPTLGDPHGLVVEEAMAARLPVISSTAAGDIAERLSEESAGLLVAPGDAAALQQAMLALAGDAPRRRTMGARALELATARDHARYARDFEDFIDRTLAASARRTPAGAAARLAGHALSLAGRGMHCAPLLASPPAGQLSRARPADEARRPSGNDAPEACTREASSHCSAAPAPRCDVSASTRIARGPS
jgi:glycosyltransferase involved in cell wall biosynthesis